MRRVTTAVLALVATLLAGSDGVGASQQEKSKHTIVPGVRVGDFTLDMSKDDVLKRLGEPEAIHLGEDEVVRRGEKKYSLNDLPRKCILSFGDVSFWINDDSVEVVFVRSPLYKLSNGLGVSRSQQKIKQAFGEDFQLRRAFGKDLLCYDAKGLGFEIDRKNQTVAEIIVYQLEGDRGDRGAPDQKEKAKVIRLSEQSAGPITFPKIDRKPKPANSGRFEMKSLPKYDPDSTNPFQVDLRGGDLSKLDLSKSIDNLLYADFDERTVWPKATHMPNEFDPKTITNLGANPGLGVRTLHEDGITGQGVGIAIIDQPLLTDHQEYADRLRLYEENNVKDTSTSQMHGPAVASIAVGKTVGVAPDADLYYIATWNWDVTKGEGAPRTYLFKAQSIRRLLKINRQLPKDRKIRVISMSVGWEPSQDGYDEIMAACKEAKAAGVFVVSCSLERVHGFRFHGLGRHPLANPDSFESYEPGLWWAKRFYDGARSHADRLLVPMDSRTTASPCSSDGYAFYRGGGWSWAVPYIAGVYALAAQVEPKITPERFWNLAIKTGRTIELEHKGETRPFGPIIDPVKLIRSISDGVGASQQEKSKHTIVPGVRVGDHTLGMSKDDVLKKLGEPDSIRLELEEDEVVRRGEDKYSLDDLPSEYVLSFGDISFWIRENSVDMVSVRSPLYKLGNGLGVGDSEQKIKQAFGKDFQPREFLGKDYLCYDAKGLAFEIHKKNQTVAEIVVYQPEGDRRDRDAPDGADAPDSAQVALVRKAAAQGRISFKLTTPEDFKEIVGQPTNEWTTHEGEFIRMEYPGVRATFWGKSGIPYTLSHVQCEGRKIDIGQDRPFALRNEEDLKILGSRLGCCAVNLSRLDLSQKGDLLERMPFDSLTVWPKPGLLPPGFEPSRRLEEGKNPGLGVRSLHQEGINGSGVGIAIIDKPLLRDHIEYADRIKSYHAIEVEGQHADMHGSAVCSIAVGKSCGVAPGANLHYYAIPFPKWVGEWRDTRPLARTIEQIIQRNRNLPPSEKVRVVSISFGGFSGMDHYDQWRAAVDKAKKNGILVVTCDDRDFVPYRSLKRIVGKDPDDPNSYGPWRGLRDDSTPLWVPIANRSMASDGGKDVYKFDTEGGRSWAAPYLAGLAALAFQVHPEISPDRIVKLWQETASRTQLGPVVNPRGFIEAVKRLKQSTPG